MFTFTELKAFLPYLSQQKLPLTQSSILHKYLHTHAHAELLSVTQTWQMTQSYRHGWHWGPGDSPGGHCLCACKEAGPRCFQDHPNQREQQSNNAPSPLHHNSPHHGRYPGPASSKNTANVIVTLHAGNHTAVFCLYFKIKLYSVVEEIHRSFTSKKELH